MNDPTAHYIAKCGQTTSRKGKPFDAWALQEHERMCPKCREIKEPEPMKND